jgi:hypothetical protein
MALITEQILSETDTQLTIKFSNKTGRSLTKIINKVDGMTNEDMLRRWHRRMTLEYLQRPFKFKVDNTIDTSTIDV